MPDFLENPTFNSNINSLGGDPSVSFDYKWDIPTNTWVPNTGVSVNVENLSVSSDDKITHDLLEGISGVLVNQDTQDVKTHGLLEGISGVLVNQDTQDVKTHGLLEGISGVLINQGTQDVKTHGLLEGVSGVLDETAANQLNRDLITHNLLAGVSGAVADIELDVGDINVDVGDIESDDKETHRMLSGISGQDEAHYSENKLLLRSISGQDNIHYNENERVLLGISGQDNVHYEENQRLLRHIKDSNCHQSLALEELKKNYRDLTYHIKKFEEENIVQEAPDFSDSSEEPFKSRLFNSSPYNGRLTDRASPEKTQYPIVSEDFSDTLDDREYVFDEGMPFSIKMENYRGDEGWHPLFPFEKKLGSDDKVTVYNESVFPLKIMFRGGDEFLVDEGVSVELTKEEACQLFVKRDYTISGFEVRYAIERMYTPEENVSISAGDHEFLLPEQTHARLGLGKISADDQYVYVAYGNQWKRVAIANWEECSNKALQAFSIDYFDAHVSPSYLYLNTIWGQKRVAIAEWTTESARGTECYNEIWADEAFLYAKSHSPQGKEWRRYAISSYSES
jgi:hypothetical protein